MAFEVIFYKFQKRENSTKQPGASVVGLSMNVTLKESTSLNNPAFLVELQTNGAGDPNKWPDYNYCYVPTWGRYYFISDWINEGLLWRAQCNVDVLASYKTEILKTTQFVSYSSVHGNTWLADTRIPVLKSTTVGKSTASLIFFLEGGFYILSCIGKTGSCLYALDEESLKTLISNIAGADDDFDGDTVQRVNNYYGASQPISAEEALYAMAQVATQNDILGKAYSTAPSCLRSCLYVPFTVSSSSGREDIWLGNYNTRVKGIVVNAAPVSGKTTISIPWHYSDWRRGYCETVYLYIPLVGMVNISADAITHVSSLTIKWSYTITDGTVAFQVLAGDEVVGSYGGSCAINYPLGINQQASAGQVNQAVIQGLTQAVSAGVTGNVLGAVMGIASTAYNALDVAMTTHPSCVGGIGGGAGSGLPHDIVCYTVTHETIIEPDAMCDTMGLPTMKPLQLSSCSGYCQCANAHVAADASLEELNAITAMLNSGFYIE